MFWSSFTMFPLRTGCHDHPSKVVILSLTVTTSLSHSLYSSYSYWGNPSVSFSAMSQGLRAVPRTQNRHLGAICLFNSLSDGKCPKDTLGREVKRKHRALLFVDKKRGENDFKNINNFFHFPVLPRAANGTDGNSF